MSDNYKFETLALHAGNSVDATNSRSNPVYRTAAYLFNDTEHAANLFSLKEPGNIYTRLMNPTHDVLEKRVAALEGGIAGLAVASGTSAIFYTVINICTHGNEVVATNNLYGGTYTMFNDILPGMGINVRFVPPDDMDAVENAINDNTRMLYCETIGNPALDVARFKELSQIAKKHHIPLVVDSTFATPYLVRPIEHGADIVIHSLTKWLGGHGTSIGGIVVDSGRFDWSDSKFSLYNKPDNSYHGLRYAHDLGELTPMAFIVRMRLVPLRNLGASISPDNAWMFLQGLETLPLRMQRHCDNALAAALHLQKHSLVEWVRYPGLETDPAYNDAKSMFKNGFGGVVVFGIKGGVQQGMTFIENLKLISHLANVGDAKSLAIHPASTTHSQMSVEQQKQSGISPEMIRLSVGIEHIDDIIDDIDNALEMTNNN